MKNKSVLFVVMCIFTACSASTKIVGFSDPDYTSKQYQNVLVFASNLGLDDSSQLEHSLCEKFVKAKISCFEHHLLFPPTRSFSIEDRFARIKSKEIQSLLMITFGSDRSSSQVIGYQAYGNSFSSSGQTSGSGMAVPFTQYSRQASARITLVDTSTRENAWLADATITGDGKLKISNDAFRDSLAEEAAKILTESNHFNNAKRTPRKDQP